MKPTDWLMVGLTAIYVGISFFGLRAIKRQTDVASAAAEAAKLNAQAVINAERPFILVESRGDRGTEFWIKNCGKSPAQMLHIDPIPKMAWPKFDAAEQEWEMPVPPNYGNAHESGEQFNVAWLAPGEERCFHSFDPSIFKEFAGTLRAELNQGLRRFYLYHGIKYRGIITKDVFETRYCYAWGARGFYMAGPYGYNKNT